MYTDLARAAVHMQDAPCTMDSGMTACRLGYRHETLTVAVNVDRVIITESSSPHPPSAAETMTVMRQRAAKAGLVCREYLETTWPPMEAFIRHAETRWAEMSKP